MLKSARQTSSSGTDRVATIYRARPDGQAPHPPLGLAPAMINELFDILAGLRACFDMVTTLPARLMNVSDYGIAVGHPADLVVLDSCNPAMAVAELAPPLFGWKRGRRSFTRAAATIHCPGEASA